MGPLLRSPDLVQDDARIYLYWPARLWDRDLFRGDLVADYFQAVTPPGYTLLFGALSLLADPVAVSKAIPPLLGLLAALFTFLLVRRLHPAPAAAWLATALQSWYLWRHDDLVSATPRAFALPLLAAFLWALLAGRRAAAVAILAASALLYPVGALIGLGVLGLRLLRLERRLPLLTSDRAAWLTFAAALGLVGLILLAQLLSALPYGPVATAADGRRMAEFGPAGRQEFFVKDPYQFWLEGTHSGLDLRVKDSILRRVPVLLELGAIAALLPLLLLFRGRLPTARRVAGSTVLLQILLASLALFALAHLLLFRLYLPNRYLKWSLPLVLAIAAALAVTGLLEALATRLRLPRRGLLAGGLALAAAPALALYPVAFDIPVARDRFPTINAFLRQQPRDVLVAGPTGDATMVAVFARRRVLVSYESALPYHLGFYRQARQRVEDVIAAYYTASPRRLAEFVEQYAVDYLLVNRDAFDKQKIELPWTGAPTLNWEPFTTEIADRARLSSRSVLFRLVDRCAAADDGRVALVPKSCILEERDRQPAP